jgi:succinoglycan biosynthesis transport protein ExoP
MSRMMEGTMEENQVELIDYLRILWRQKWVIAATFVAAVAVAWVTSRAVNPTYQTETSLLLLPPLSTQLGAEAVGSRLAPEAYEELAVSTSLLQSVVEKLELPESESIDALKKRFSVSVKRLSSQGELLLRTTVTGTDPDRLPDIAGAWTAAFADTYGELFQDRIARSYTYVSENYVETGAELAALIEERTFFLADHPLVVLSAEVEALGATLTSNSVKILQARQELGTAEAYLAARERSRVSQLPTLVLTSDVDPHTLAGALAFGLSADEYGGLVEARIEDLERDTRTISEQLAAKQQTLDAAEATLSELNRNIGLLEEAHGRLALKLQDAKIALAETPEPIRVIDEPLTPRTSIAPKKTTNIAVAGFLGLMLGTLLAFFVDYLARVHKEERTPAEDERDSEKLGDRQTGESGRTEDGNDPPLS